MRHAWRRVFNLSAGDRGGGLAAGAPQKEALVQTLAKRRNIRCWCCCWSGRRPGRSSSSRSQLGLSHHFLQEGEHVVRRRIICHYMFANFCLTSVLGAVCCVCERGGEKRRELNKYGPDVWPHFSLVTDKTGGRAGTINIKDDTTLPWQSIMLLLTKIIVFTYGCLSKISAPPP